MSSVVSARFLAPVLAALAWSGAAGFGSRAPADTPASAAAPGIVSTEAAALSPVDDALLRRVIGVSTEVKSYQALIHADIAFHSFPFITTHVDGNVYFKAPDRQAVVFDTVPVLAGSLKKFYPNVPSPSRWASIYTISSLGEATGATTYRLIPKKHGRVEHLDVRVDDAKATIDSYTWTYEDGGDITFDQTYRLVSGHAVVASQIGKVELPAYKADVVSKISNFKLGVPVADSVFDEPK